MPPAATAAIASIVVMAQLLTRLDLRGVSGDLRALLPAPKAVGEGPVQVVKEILAAVKAGGDKAVAELTERFDGGAPASLRVPPGEISAAAEHVSAELRTALEEAARSIRDFHEAELVAHHGFEHVGPDGIVTTELLVPVDRAGCYVPGGRAPLASTVLMTALIAKVAGVAEIVVCSPPGPDGHVAAAVLAAADVTANLEVGLKLAAKAVDSGAVRELIAGLRAG